MILTEDFGNGDYRITGYEPGAITINHETTYRQSLIVSTHTLITDWPPQSLKELNPDHLQPILELKPAIVLIGTGQRFILPDRQPFAIFPQSHIGIEYMDTGAACRTFMALMAEGRNVVAALLIN